MDGIPDYNGFIWASMEKAFQEVPFNEEKTVEGSTNLFLILSDIRQVNLQFSFISSNIYDSFDVKYICSSLNFESSLSDGKVKNTIDLYKENNKYTFCVSLPKCDSYTLYLLFRCQSIDGDNNINIKTIDICPHAIPLYGNTTFDEDGKIYFYLDISNYKIGDNIYLQFIFNLYDYINNFLLYYKFSDDHYIDSFKNLKEINITTYVYNETNSLYIFYDSLKVKENVNYILFYAEFNSFYSPLTVKHTKTNEFLKKDGINVIFIIILATIIIIIILIIVLIIYFIKKNKNKNTTLLETSEKESMNEIENKINNAGNDKPTPYPIDTNMDAPPTITNNN